MDLVALDNSCRLSLTRMLTNTDAQYLLFIEDSTPEHDHFPGGKYTIKWLLGDVKKELGPTGWTVTGHR